MAQKRGLRAGWYHDPDVSARFRWWNGSQWTQWLSSDPHESFPPPGGEAVTPVPTRRDKVMRGVWVALAVIALAMAVMASIGVVTNQRRIEARGAIPWPRQVSPASTRSPADGYGDMWSTNKGLITLERTFSVQAPTGEGWELSDEGKATDLSPYFDPTVTSYFTAKPTAKNPSGSFFVGVPEQPFIPETVGETGPATMRAFIQRTWGGEKNEPVKATVRRSQKQRGLADGLVAWRVTFDFTSNVKDVTLVLDAVFFQTGPNAWMVMVLVMGKDLEGRTAPQFEAAVSSVTLLEG